MCSVQGQIDNSRQLLIAELAGTLLCIMLGRRRFATQQLLAHISAEWQSVPDTWRPWGFWVREYDFIPADADGVDFLAVPQRVWFHDRAGFRPENIWKWMRFVAAQTLAPTMRATDQFPIGRTAFAPYDESDDYYLEVLWAGRYGMGWRVSLGPDGGSTLKKELWIA